MMYLRMSDEHVYTVGDIYNKNKTDQTLMLSNYPADFWKPYRDNNTYFDKNHFNLLMNVDASKRVIGENQAFFLIFSGIWGNI